MSFKGKFRNNAKYPSRLLLISGIMVVLLIVCAIIASKAYNLNGLSDLFTPSAVKYWISLIVGFITSIFATIFYDLTRKREENTLVSRIKKIADSDLLESTLDNLELYNNNYYNLYEISAILQKEPNNRANLIKLHISYTIQKVITQNEFKIQFYRIRNQQERDDFKQKLKAAASSAYDYFESFDEEDLDANNITEADYSLTRSEIVVNKKSYKLQRVVDGNCISYIADIPKELKNNKDFAEFSFDIDIVLEKDSYINFIVDVPVKEIVCRLNYNDVAKDIIIGGAYYLNSSITHDIFEKAPGENHEFYINQDGWILPKSALVYIWWKNDRRNKR